MDGNSYPHPQEPSDKVTGLQVFQSTLIGFGAGALCGVGGYNLGGFPVGVSVWFAIGMATLAFVGVGVLYIGQRLGESLGLR